MILTVLDSGSAKMQTLMIIRDHLNLELNEIKELSSLSTFQLNVDDVAKTIGLEVALIKNGCKVRCIADSDDINYESVSTKNLQFMVEECDANACFELSKRYAHGTILLKCDKERSKELRRLGMLYRYGSTISPEFEEEKQAYKSVFLDENGKPYIDWQAKSEQMEKLLDNFETLVERYNDIASDNDKTQRMLSDLSRPVEVKEAPKFFSKWFTVIFVISLIFILTNLLIVFITLVCRYWIVKKKKEKYNKYLEDLQNYKTEKSRLTIANAKEEREVASVLANVQDVLYDGLNVGLSIPLNKDIITRNTYIELFEELKKLFALNGKAMLKNNSVSKIFADKRYYDAKLRFFYTYSLRAETELDEVYNYYQEKIQKSASTGDSDLLRKDDLPFVKQHNAEMSQDLSEIKTMLDDDRLANVMSEIGYVQGQETSTFGGLWTDEKKLTDKSNELKKLYDVAKFEYEELTDSNKKINYWLDYVRAYAYRNIYLGAELINIVRSSNGGRTLATQKDGIDVSMQSFDLQEVTINDTSVDLDAHINKTVDVFTHALMHKQSRKWMKSNPKMAMGAAALTFVGGALLDKLDKHTQLVEEHTEFQKNLISNIKVMTEGYEEGKASSLRAIEIIRAIAKANKGFMAVYEPLREKCLENGEPLTMQDMQAIAKATKDYKNISDSKLKNK